MSANLEKLFNPPKTAEEAAQLGLLKLDGVQPTPVQPTPVQPKNEVPAMGRARPKTSWTLEELMATEFPDPVWVVPDLLPAGLGILAGRPKLGKSFLALQLAVAVGSGGFFLDRPVPRGHVLYIALEDSPRRLRGRLRQMGARGGDIRFELNWPPMTGDGAKLLQDYILQHKPRLVIIDTLARAFGRKIDWDNVSDATGALDELQRLALERDCCILFVDHHRKPGAQSHDVIDDILNSTAKPGVADVLWGLYRERGKPGATLALAGRDLGEATELSLVFDRTTCCWQLGEATDGVKPDSVQALILDALDNIGPMTVTELSVHLDKPKSNIVRELNELVTRGRVKKGPGHYAPYELC